MLKITDNVASLESPIRDVVLKAAELEKKGRKIIYLNIGDPALYDFDMPQQAKEAGARAMMDKKPIYPTSEGIIELRSAIAKRENSVAENVQVTNGISEGMIFLFSCLLNTGENILMPSPSYSQYVGMSKLWRGEDNYYSCDEQAGWIPDMDDVRKKVNKKTKAILLINPNNPTGAVYPRNIVKEFCDIAAENKLPLISDEIYEKIVYEGKFVSPKEFAKNGEFPLIVTNGFSKTYASPGMRVGYFVFYPGTEVLRDGVAKLLRLRLSMNIYAQYAALAELEGPQNHIPGMISKLKKRGEFVARRLNEIPGLSCVPPKGAFYVFPKISSNKWKNDRDFVYELLEQKGVLTVFGSGFSPVLKEKYFRIVYLAQEEILEKAMNGIEEFVRNKK
ncbi:Aspartate aminotransferase [Candidatus Gugararchaeum adminiculabundum]|nr:Aspartate aminotransferase [Candidatus Gugararchaeum adminiculabundum]